MRLAHLGAEILYGFKVQQAVDGLLVGVLILFVHLAADLHAQFRHFERIGDVKRDGDQHDDGIADVKEHREDHRDHGQFKDQWPDGKQHEAQKELHPLHATLDDPAEAAGLAGDVIAHRQAVDMGEGFQRQLAQRALPDADKDRVAQFVEARGADPRQTIGHGQAHRAQHQQHRIVPRAAAQRIDGGLVEERCGDRDELGHQQRQKRQHHAPLHPRMIFGPEIGRHPPQCPGVAPPAFPSCHVTLIRHEADSRQRA